jgi:hypothetical protein
MPEKRRRTAGQAKGGRFAKGFGAQTGRARGVKEPKRRAQRKEGRRPDRTEGTGMLRLSGLAEPERRERGCEAAVWKAKRVDAKRRAPLGGYRVVFIPVVTAGRGMST